MLPSHRKLCYVMYAVVKMKMLNISHLLRSYLCCSEFSFVTNVFEKHILSRGRQQKILFVYFPKTPSHSTFYVFKSLGDLQEMLCYCFFMFILLASKYPMFPSKTTPCFSTLLWPLPFYFVTPGDLYHHLFYGFHITVSHVSVLSL